MSQVVKAITATDSGERRHIPKGLSPLFTDVFVSKSEVSDAFSTMGEVGIRYRIGVKLGADCLVTDYERMNSDNTLQHAIDRTKRQVIEGIFGEFRPHIRRIEKAIYDYNYEEAGRLLHEMERVMFEELE
mgnify:CR=1 FL=1|jgi:hypothetical protein